MPELQPKPRFTILIDGLCPLCAKEASIMRWLDGGRGRLAIVDISAPGFDAARYGTTYDAVMGEIHGVLPGNRLVTGVEVFRHAYGAIGWGWVLAPTAWLGLRWLSDIAYRWFARNRLWLTGRKDCETGACKVK